jgi:putative peptidoglycan lipid II flippase
LSDIAKTSFIVTIFTVLGMGLGFLSSIVIAEEFGAGGDMDVFLAATTVPLFITSIFSGALIFTFIPVFAEYRAKKPDEIWTVVSSFLNLNVAVTTVLCISGILLAYPIVKVLTPGFAEPKLVRSAEMLQWLFPIIIFTVVNELMASVYYSNRRFVIPSLNKITSPLITIAYVMLFHNIMSTKSIILAMLTATIVQTVLLAFGFFRTKDFRYSFVFDYNHPGVIKILKLMTPLILGMLIYRALPIIDRFFLSQLSEGSISHIGYAWKLVSAIPPVIATGISVSIFPLMSRYAAENNYDALREIMSKGIRMLFFMSIPFVLLLGAYGDAAIQVMFERGAFTSADTSAVYHAFSIYLLALPAMVIGSIIGQGYYVLQDTVTPALLGIVETIIYFSLCFILIKRFGFLTIPITYAVYFNLSMLGAFIVRYKLGSRGGYRIILSCVKHSCAALISLLFITATIKIIGAGTLQVLFLISISFLIYGLISRLIFKTDEACEFEKLVRNGLSAINSKYRFHTIGW